MKTTTEKVPLTKDNYESVLGMLNSTDPESRLVGLAIIEEANFKESLTTILMLKKNSNSDSDSWLKHAPLTCKRMSELGIEATGVPTFRKILKAITTTGVDGPQMEMFIDFMNRHILTEVRSMGYPFIEDIHVKVKFKEE